MTTRRFPSAESGIVIGPILFVLALLAILAVVMSSNMGNYGSASITDRVGADIVSQANLIRTKIYECNIKYGTDGNGDGFPSSDTTNGTLVSALTCAGDPAGLQNLWTGARNTLYPPPTNGFGPWYYINTNGTGLGGTATGGRCLWTVPTSASPSTNVGLVNGLTKAAGKFDHATTCTDTTSCSQKVIYDPASASQKFVVWITPPTGTPNSHCLP